MKTSKKMKTNRTNKTNLLSIGCVAVLLTFSTGCSEEEPENLTGNCFDGNWAQQYSSELQAWSSAGVAYSEEPTTANCANYKTAAKNYLDALRAVVKCVPTASSAEINASINEAKAEIDKEGCD